MIVWPEGRGPTAYQDEALGETVARGRGAVRGPHGLGKTTIAALLVLWFAETREILGRLHDEDWKAGTTAGAWLQLTHYLWPEIHKWARRMRWDLLGRERYDERAELLTLQLVLEHGRAFSAAPGEASSIEGLHADHVAYIYDEAKNIPDGTFDATEGAFAGVGETFAFAISTPGPPSGRFWQIHARQAGYESWWTRHVTLEEAISAGRISREWAEERGRQWGIDSALYKNRVEGEFASSDEQAIPLPWVEEAQLRWKALEAEHSLRTGPITAIGVDVADTGEDVTAIAPRRGNRVDDLIYSTAHGMRDDEGDPQYGAGVTMATDRVVSILGDNSEAVAVIDVLGVGAGVAGEARRRVEERNRRRVIPFNAMVPVDWTDSTGELKFQNLRAAGWWHLRELLDPKNGHEVALPPDDRLTGDLTAPWWLAPGPGGKMRLASKDDIRKVIGRSPDSGDAVVHAFWAEMAQVAAWTSAAQTAGVRLAR